MSNTFSDYIVFVDESGDHGLVSIDPNYPVFVLVFTIFKKEEYINQLVPALLRFKHKHFGHDVVVLHERDIRRDLGDFTFLKSKDKKQAFISELTDLVQQTPFVLVTTVIQKERLKSRYVEPDNPYHIALAFGLERVFHFLRDRDHVGKITHIVVERRGAREDQELELEFRRVVDGANYLNTKLPFQIVFAHKQINSAGLQLSDLIARPIGLSILRPQQANRAFEILKDKFYKNKQGKTKGWGLKFFP